MISGKIDAFLAAREAYEAEDSSAKHLAKDEAGKWSPVVEAVIG